MVKKRTLTGQLRDAIDNCGHSRYWLAQQSGVPEAALCRFMAGKSIRLETADKLAAALNLEFAARPTKRSK